MKRLLRRFRFATSDRPYLSPLAVLVFQGCDDPEISLGWNNDAGTELPAISVSRQPAHGPIKAGNVTFSLVPPCKGRFTRRSDIRQRLNELCRLRAICGETRSLGVHPRHVDVHVGPVELGLDRLERLPERVTSLHGGPENLTEQRDLQYGVDVRLAPNSISQVRAGTIRAYAVTADKRVDSAPEIPTTDEAGLPGFHMTLWSGFWVPKGTPKDIVTKLNGAAVEALSDPAVRKKLGDLGLDMPPKDQLSPQALGTWQKAEIAKWWPMIKSANIKME